VSLVRRNLYKGKVTDLLAKADDEAFFIMVWATHAIQTERSDKARPFLTFPQKAVTDDLASEFAVHPWKLETILNELLAIRKSKLLPNRPNRYLDCRQFRTIAHVIKMLAELENAQDGLALKRVDVFREMHRLGQRQFEWQRGFLSYPQFYRSGFIYSGDLTRSFFADANGFTIADFSLASFALHSLFLDNPVVLRKGGMGQIGIPEKTLGAIFDLVSIPHARARKRAANLRSGPGHPGYKPSLFRDYPCVAFGDAGERVHAPLPDLVTLRSTSGLFYDVIKGGDNVRNEISRRFETYCLEFIRSMLPSHVVKSSYKYRFRKDQMDTPDLLVYGGGAISLVLECKATRMSYEARSSEEPMADARRGYQEMAKGVFQIWRFASHHRRGLLGHERLQQGVKGIVLTLDTWLSMAPAMQSDVFELARTMAANRDPGIIEADQIPVIFCPIDDLEQTLGAATEASFFRSVNAAMEKRFQGWRLSGVHREIAPEVSENKGYPFVSRMAEVLPWWSRFGQSSNALV
jgi:hypothetical protein